MLLALLYNAFSRRMAHCIRRCLCSAASSTLVEEMQPRRSTHLRRHESVTTELQYYSGTGIIL